MLMADVSGDLENCVNPEVLMNLADPNIEVQCPIAIDIVNCVDNVVEDHTGYKMEYLAYILAGTDIGKAAKLFINLRAMLLDLCTEGSDLNARYKENAACFRNSSSSNQKTLLYYLIQERNCTLKAEEAYKAYFALEENRVLYRNSNKECMVEAYKSACTAAYFHEKCGQPAFDFYQDLIKRTGIFRLLLCSPEALNDLKTKFVQSLDMSESQRMLFRAGFDLRKRKK